MAGPKVVEIGKRLSKEEEQRKGKERTLLHCRVRWFSKGRAFMRFWNLKERVLKYLEENNKQSRESLLLQNKDGLGDLAFLTDISSFVNTILLFGLDFGVKKKLMHTKRNPILLASSRTNPNVNDSVKNPQIEKPHQRGTDCFVII
ncbi:hypothetical protein TNCV_1628661 [Trichonephila clavipes]|nr:hypothetical protein TNCV_1628661 [Trichonephila clavipes]